MCIPANPKKCIGKNVMFTPKKKRKKSKSAKKKSYTHPVILGNQKKKPAKTEETAPIDKT
jgi:hypothetical protein